MLPWTAKRPSERRRGVYTACCKLISNMSQAQSIIVNDCSKEIRVVYEVHVTPSPTYNTGLGCSQHQLSKNYQHVGRDLRGHKK